ncbi:hypothetical protein [Salinibius halmophilus]|uniref:hypothetical protein n=1 Tax=Salinibius halmophilus TaxID=1853216 RepID=UPI000E66E7DE|nr:hypothetical protein [Salinibius halmophilus]
MFARYIFSWSLPLFIAASATAIEWEEAYYQVNAGAAVAVPFHDADMPLGYGARLQADYVLPLLVEQHWQAVFSGGFQWTVFRPEKAENQVGATSYLGDVTAILRRDMVFDNGRKFWYGLGLGVQGAMEAGIYRWIDQSGEFAVQTLENQTLFATTVNLNTSLEITDSMQINFDAVKSVYPKGYDYIATTFGLRF